MQIICVSRCACGRGEEFAELLARKLGYWCMSRETLVEAATREGIQVGKLEMAIMRPSLFTERLALEQAHYLAFVRSHVCDRAQETRLVYHGRTGHLLFPGISQILRVRVLTSQECRIQLAMNKLDVERAQARRFLEEVDDGCRRWAHLLYGARWEDAVEYDLTVNLEQLSVESAASALTNMAQLPEFQMTPASNKAMNDLRLGAHVRLALARDERTHGGNFKVRADGGVVTVSYVPQDARYASPVTDVASAVPGVETVRSTMATTSILWVQDGFEPDSESFHDVVEIATKWNAAVELVKLETAEQSSSPAPSEEKDPDNVLAKSDGFVVNGGIEDDDKPEGDEGLMRTLGKLAALGRSGCGRTVKGGAQALLNALDRSIPYSLVVLGDVFCDRGPAAKLRMKRELQSFLGDHIMAPVVAAEELKVQYLFGWRDALRAISLITVVALVFVLVFTNQKSVLILLGGEWWEGGGLGHWVAALVIIMVVPLIAYSYGTFVKSLLKLLKIE